MKKILFLSLFSFFVSTCFAQDSIFKRNNDIIVAAIIEVTPIEIKYKKHNFQDYKIGQRQMQSILMQTKDKKIMQLIVEAQKARKREPIFIATFPLAIGGLYLIYFASSYGNRNNSDSDIYYAIGGFAIAAAIACSIVSIDSKHKKMNANSAAIKLYNHNF